MTFLHTLGTATKGMMTGMKSAMAKVKTGLGAIMKRLMVGSPALPRCRRATLSSPMMWRPHAPRRRAQGGTQPCEITLLHGVCN